MGILRGVWGLLGLGVAFGFDRFRRGVFNGCFLLGGFRCGLIGSCGIFRIRILRLLRSTRSIP